MCVPLLFFIIIMFMSIQCGLRRGSVAARMLRLWARIPPGHGWMSVVLVVCCRVAVSATS